MLMATNSPNPLTEKPAAQRTRIRLLFEVVLWLAGVVLAFVVPMLIVLAAVIVSSYGIPLPIEVRVP